jgi:hypothetical protein
MKNLLAILLSLFLISNLHAQDGKVLKILGTAATWSILNGIGDGLNDSGEKGWGHAVNALSAAVLIGGTVWSEPNRKDWLRYIVIYAGARYVTFDPAYNLTRGLPVTYIGTTATIDKEMSKVPPGMRTFSRGLMACFTIGFTINNYGIPKEQHYRHNKKFKIE